MKNSGSRFYLSQTPVPKMPPGLVDLMEGMTKEVLKRNPTDVYEFCAVYMRTLLEIRDGVGMYRYCLHTFLIAYFLDFIYTFSSRTIFAIENETS